MQEVNNLSIELNEELSNLFSSFKRIATSLPVNKALNFTENAIIMHMYFIKLSKKDDTAVKISDINEKMQLSRAALSQNFNSLEEKGYIKRKIQVEDRRSIILEITEKGKKIQDESVTAVNEFCKLAQERFGKEKFMTLLTLSDEFAKLTQEIKEMEAGD